MTKGSKYLKYQRGSRFAALDTRPDASGSTPMTCAPTLLLFHVLSNPESVNRHGCVLSIVTRPQGSVFGLTRITSLWHPLRDIMNRIGLGRTFHSSCMNVSYQIG